MVRRGASDRGFYAILLIAGAVILGLLGTVVLLLVQGAAPSLGAFGPGFFWGLAWDPVFDHYGALPFVYGTLVSSGLALLIALPLGLGAATFLSEFSPRPLVAPLSFAVELLAAVPSVVYGLWGIYVLAPIMRENVEPALAGTLGFLPLFRGPSQGLSMLTAGVILAVMILPIIASISREALKAVPRELREGALALGATRWEAVRYGVLPFAKPALLGAAFLGFARAFGETMAVTMVIGNRPEISASLFAPGYTMAAVIANEFTEAVGDLHLSALFEIGLVLLLVGIAVNAGARLLIYRVAGPRRQAA